MLVRGGVRITSGAIPWKLTAGITAVLKVSLVRVKMICFVKNIARVQYCLDIILLVLINVMLMIKSQSLSWSWTESESSS